MKKLLPLLLALMLVFCLAACGSTETPKTEGPVSSDPPADQPADQPVDDQTPPADNDQDEEKPHDKPFDYRFRDDIEVVAEVRPINCELYIGETKVYEIPAGTVTEIEIFDGPIAVILYEQAGAYEDGMRSTVVHGHLAQDDMLVFEPWALNEGVYALTFQNPGSYIVTVFEEETYNSTQFFFEVV